MAKNRVVAAIDIGSNSLRLLIAEARPRARLRELDRLVVPIMIGRDTFTSGRISNSTLREVQTVLKGFARKMKEYGVSSYRAIATSAVREALNRDTFLDSLQTASGLSIQVVEAIEETRLVHQVVARSLGPALKKPGKTLMLLALGAGSAEITVFKDGSLISTETGRIGTLRLVQTLASDASDRLLYQRLSAFVINVATTLERVHDIPRIDTLVTVNTELHELLDKASFRGVRRSDGLIRLSAPTFRSIARRVQSTPVERRVSRWHLGYDAAETLTPALIVVQSFLDTTSAREILVPHVSVLDSLLLDVLSTAPSFEDEIVASALSIGRKYRFDEAHSLHVARLSLMLFDQLQSFCSLKPEYRLLLRISAVLHDIGIFVSSRSHHKHSEYLILQSEILGVSAEDLQIIAQVARYHRRATPRETHFAYWALPQPSRVAVSKIAAILRLADALDRNHSQEIVSVRALPADDELTLEVKSRGDLLVDEWALDAKADLFREVFGLPVTLSRA